VRPSRPFFFFPHSNDPSLHFYYEKSYPFLTPSGSTGSFFSSPGLLPTPLSRFKYLICCNPFRQGKREQEREKGNPTRGEGKEPSKIAPKNGRESYEGAAGHSSPRWRGARGKRTGEPDREFLAQGRISPCRGIPPEEGPRRCRKRRILPLEASAEGPSLENLKGIPGRTPIAFFFIRRRLALPPLCRVLPLVSNHCQVHPFPPVLDCKCPSLSERKGQGPFPRKGGRLFEFAFPRRTLLPTKKKILRKASLPRKEEKKLSSRFFLSLSLFSPLK